MGSTAPNTHEAEARYEELAAALLFFDCRSMYTMVVLLLVVEQFILQVMDITTMFLFIVLQVLPPPQIPLVVDLKFQVDPSQIVMF